MNVKIINRDRAIGNIILELLRYGKDSIDIDEILSYNDVINDKLHNSEYRVLLGWNNIYEFVFDYPYLCTLLNETITFNTDDMKTLIYRYNRYFRIGAPMMFVEAVQDAVAERYKKGNEV